MTRSLSAQQVADKSAKNRASHKKIDLRPGFRAELVRDYGKAAGIAFDKAQVAKPAVAPSQQAPVKPARPKKAVLPVPTEHQEQKAVIDWFEVYARIKGLSPSLLFAIPNGGARHIVAAVKLKAEGVRAGVPDLMLAVPKRETFQLNHLGYAPVRWVQTDFCGLFIEMKRIGGKPTVAQINFADLLRRQGFNVVIVQGADEAIRAIKAYLS